MCLALLGQTFLNLFLDNISVYFQTDNLTACVARPWPVGQVNAKVSAMDLGVCWKPEAFIWDRDTWLCMCT